jgi:hypothetical protein
MNKKPAVKTKASIIGTINGSVLHFGDPFGPAAGASDWEALHACEGELIFASPSTRGEDTRDCHLIAQDAQK